MRHALAIVAVLSATFTISGCGTTPRMPEVPETVTVVVKEYRPWPSWMTDPLPEHVPASQAVGALLQSGNARLETIRVENCRKALARRLGAGEEVNPRDCPDPPPGP